MDERKTVRSTEGLRTYEAEKMREGGLEFLHLDKEVSCLPYLMVGHRFPLIITAWLNLKS